MINRQSWWRAPRLVLVLLAETISLLLIADAMRDKCIKKKKKIKCASLYSV